MIEFTSSNVGKMEDEMVAVLNKYGFKNVEFTGNTRSYGSTETTFKIVANIKGVKSKKDSNLELYAKMDGIDHTKTGRKGETIVEYHPRKRKYPYIYISRSGARYKGSAARMIQLGFAA